MTLAEYLRSMRDRRWKPGTLDCGVFMADWVRERMGVDPIADVRGTYDSERQFLRILRREGGFETSCAARLAAVGWKETKNPKAGDVIIVMAPYAERRGKTQRRPTGGLFVGVNMHGVMTSDLGLVVVKGEMLPLIKAWTFNG
jgi:hypothetical protein